MAALVTTQEICSKASSEPRSSIHHFFLPPWIPFSEQICLCDFSNGTPRLLSQGCAARLEVTNECLKVNAKASLDPGLKDASGSQNQTPFNNNCLWVFFACFGDVVCRGCIFVLCVWGGGKKNKQTNKINIFLLLDLSLIVALHCPCYYFFQVPSQGLNFSTHF